MEIPTDNILSHWSFNQEHKILIITLPSNLRNKQWAEEFGALYELIKNTEISKIEVNAKNTFWIDPIPLLSLLVLFNQFITLLRENLRIILPITYTGNRLNNREIKSNIFLKFLYEEGFLDKLNNVAVINNNVDVSSFDLFKKRISELTIDLNYFDCHLLNARIIDSSKIHEGTDDELFYKEIDSLIEEVRVNLLNKKIPQANFENILYKIRLFFSETINNVYQYAYPDCEKKYFGIYTRYRYGMQNNSIEGYREKLKVLLKNESNNHSKLFYDCTDTIFMLREGCIELFIVDIGIGIAESTGYRKTENHPTRKAYIDILNSNLIRNKETSGNKNHTKNGGLYVIGKHIEETQDFILFKDYEDWLAGILPEMGHNESFDRIKTISGIHTPGCIIQTTLSWFNPTNKLVNNWSKVKDIDIVNNLFQIYKIQQGNAEILKNFIFIDERIINKPNIVSKKEYITKKIKEKEGISKAIIYLPNKGMTKHLLAFKILTQIAIELSYNTSIIIADIPDEERLIYYEALCSTIYNNQEIKPFLSKINQIVLISVSLTFCTFEISDNKIQHSNELQNDFCNSRVYGLSLSMILEALITNDSLIIWNDVKTNKHSDIFINGKINWNNNEYLDEYLDFNRLSMVPSFTKLFLHGIARFSGLLDSNAKKFVGIDVLVENLVSKLIDQRTENEEADFKVFIGSVFVKGFTQNETIYSNIDSIVIHCFQHPSLFENPILKLFYWPRKEWINSNFIKTSPEVTYKRIGRTPAIAIDGWQYFPVPRYLPNESSYYYLSPKESYLNWQNPQIGLRLGHFKYGKHYDIIKVNIKAIVEKSFLEKSDLARFLVANFYFATGGNNPNELILDPDYRDIKDDLNFKDFYKNSLAVVYPNHISNSFIIEKISEILHNDLMEKIIPLNYIRNDNSKTNHLFSPLNFNKIKNNISTETSNIVFFDDTIVSGRTRKEVKHLLFGFGVKEVKTLAIYDRQRLPYSIPNPKTNKFYARLDIPRLGSGNNPLLNAMNKALTSLNLIESAKQRILEWKLRWDVNSSIEGFNSNILYPISINPIKKKYSTKKIGDNYVQIGGDENKILLTNSIGITTYCLELFCMTGRDDIILKYCKILSNERVKIELICCNLLLYNHEFKNSIKKELIRELLLSTNYYIPDSYSSLAAITILTLNQDLVTDISKEDYATNNCNVDIQIAFAIQTHDSQDSSIITDSYNNYISNVKVQNNQGLINISDFHRQIYEKRKSHISPLHAIINGNRPLEIRISALRTALEKLIWHCDYLLPIYSVRVEELRKFVIECKKKTDEYIIGINKDYNSIEEIIRKYILPPIEEAHSKLFFEITSNEFTIEKLIVGLINEKILSESYISETALNRSIEDEPDFLISSSGQKVLDDLHQNNKLPLWIPLTDNIRLFIKDLIYNILQGFSERIVDPFSDLKLPLSQIWYSFSYCEADRKFIILFANGIKDDKSYENAHKTRHRKTLYDYQLDIDLQYELKKTDVQKVLITKLIFPTI